MSIGVRDWEKHQKQTVTISLYADIIDSNVAKGDDLANTLSYSDVVSGIQAIADQGHFELLETFAGKIASMCLHHSMVTRVQVSVSKPDIYKDIGSVGATVTRHRL
jgi:dihydroneopterin aldolase